MHNLEQLKQKYAEQVRADYENPTISPYVDKWHEGIDLLFNFIQVIPDLSAPLLGALEDVLIKRPTDYNALAAFINYLEKYLKEIVFIVNPTVKSESLINLIRELIVGYGGFGCHNRKDVKKFSEQSPFLESVCIAYCTRNEIDHARQRESAMPRWSNDHLKILQNRNSMLVVLLLATLRHFDAISTAINQRHIDGELKFKVYLEGVKRKFERWKTRFVSLQGMEKIELYAREELENPDRPARHGSIMQLYRDLKNKQFMLLGDAGMGKTTTLQYLAYEQAEACLQNPVQTQLPVYLELKLLSGGKNLQNTIFNMLGFEFDFMQTLWEENRLALFLDGLNELPKSECHRVVNEIQALLNQYPALSLIISGRASQRFTVGENQRLPVFALLRMNDEQLAEFLEKNSTPVVYKLIQAQIAEDTNDNLRDWLRIPMLFMMLLEVALDICTRYPDNAEEEFFNHTENKRLVMRTFIEKIYRREKERDMRFGADAFDTLLTALGAKIFELYQSSSSVERKIVVDTLTPYTKAFSDTDLQYFLDTAVQLGILAQDDNMYSFSHEEYFDFYAAEGVPL